MKTILGSLFLLFSTFGYTQAPSTLSIDSLLYKSSKFYKSNQDSAYYYSDLAHKKAIILKDTAEIGKTIVYKANYMLSLKLYDNAIKLLQFNMDNNDKLSVNTRANTYSVLGGIHSLREERDIALTYYLKAIDAFIELQDHGQLARNYLNIGVIYEKEEKLKQANYFYDQSLYHSNLDKNKSVEHLHDGVKNNSKIDFETKLKICKDALKSIENPNESRLAAVIYHDLSKNYIDHKKYEEAIKCAEKTIAIKNNIGYLQNLDFSYFILGKSQIRLQRNDEGIENLKKAISISEKRSLKQLMYEMIVLGYKNKNDYKLALNYTESLNKIKDSISLFKENEKIAEITTRFENEKQAKEILQLEKENQEKELLISKKEKNIWKWSLLALLATLVAIFMGQKLIRSIKQLKTVELEKEEMAKKVEEIAIILNNKTKVYLNKLKYIKSDGNYLEFITEDKTIIDRNKLKEVLKHLPPNFVRVHRSYVINKNYIDALNSKSLFLQSHIEIPLSRTYKANIV